MTTKLAKLGIVAGAGELPLQIAEACLSRSRDFHIIAIDEFAPPIPSSFPHTRFKISKVGACLRELKRTDCREVVFAGKFLRPQGPVKLRPDLGGLTFLVRYLGVLRRSDDGLHRAFADLMTRHGFRVVSPLDANPDLAARQGCLTAIEPSAAHKASFQAMLGLAKSHGASDEGQAIVVSDGAIVAREVRAGTDAMLAGLTTAQGKGAILVKAMKPNQLVSMDPPAIGESTVVNAAKAGLAGILVEAGRSVIVDEDRVRARGDELGIFVYADRIADQ
ncbi:MAG: UDP-2,3-diacylglucosamine diphosphatase LpxI [Micropepsaceae bacterium]